MRVGTWPNQSSLCRGGAGRLETGVPLRVPQLSATAISTQRAALAVGSSGEPGSSDPPGRPKLSHQRPPAGTKARGRTASPPEALSRIWPKPRKQGRGVPKVTRTRYPPSWSAKPSRAAHADPGSGRHWRLQPAGRRGLQGEGGSPEVTQRVPQGEEHPSARLRGRAPRRTWQGPVHGVAHRCFRARRWRRRARGSPGLITRWTGDPGRGRAAGHRCCTVEPAGGSWGGSR